VNSKKTKAKSKWPSKQLAIISSSQNLQMHLKELLKSHGWEIAISTASIEQVIQSAEIGEISAIIVDDSSETPSANIVRVLRSNIITAVTPTISFILDSHEKEFKAIKSLGPITLIEKPLTPIKFNKAFKEMIKTWEQNSFVALRLASYQYIHRGPQVGHEAMTKLLGFNSILPMVAHTMSLYYLENNNPSDSEKILLHALKKQPKHLGLLLALGELYMHATMPHLAHKLFSIAKQNYGNSMVILSDITQAAIALNKYTEAELNLMEMRAHHLQEQHITEFIASIQFAEGRQDQTEKMFKTKKNKFKKYNEQWIQAINPSQDIESAS
jgi:hypothetical protein